MLDKYKSPLNINGIMLDFHKETFVMGILNVTPDSFSDGGKYHTTELALEQARQMIADGAKIIDIGGESTRPGYTPVSIEEEIARIVPVIERLVAEEQVIVSVDTQKPAVARAAIEAGAHIINDIWGSRQYDGEMARVAAECHVPIILMHNRETAEYEEFWSEFLADMQESIRIARESGVPDEHIFLDPGIGFAKNLEQSMETMQRLDELSALGYPVLLATSRKRMIGAVLGLPVDERVEGTAATCAFGVMKGCHMMRVHDVKEIVRTVKMMDALVGKCIVEGELPERH